MVIRTFDSKIFLYICPAMNYRTIIMRAAKIVAKSLGVLLLVIFLAIVVTSPSPIYRFGEPKPFAGNDIFNPYANVSSDAVWARANFHTHTRVEGPLNECEYGPEQTLAEYRRYGYDIVTFSNHNLIINHPEPQLMVSLYEHGYGLLKYHKLVFGSADTFGFDHLLPILASQKQWQIELLKQRSDLVQLNHPLRTPTLNAEQLKLLSGYDLIELDSGKSTDNNYWDAALSAGHYSFATAGDDLHKPQLSSAIARRCTMLHMPLDCYSEILGAKSATYEELLSALHSGAFYAMRLPDYGDGDWRIKEQMNASIPCIKSIGLVDDESVYIQLSEVADSIRFSVDGGRTAELVVCDSVASYKMRNEDSYVRITAFMPHGEVIYTNPFARYDATVADSPFDSSMPEVSIPMTILFNAVLLLAIVFIVWAIYKLIKL